MSVLELGEKPPRLTRRGFLIGGGAAVGLLVAWSLWPRDYRPTLPLAEGEHALGGWVKVGIDGHVTVVLPQIEHGQGIFTVLAQTLADELGADWRTIGVEPAPINPAYANWLFAREAGYATLNPQAGADGRFQITGGSTSLRQFGPLCRDAGAIARALLCMAAAENWDADWQACETANGFVTRGEDRASFGTLAERAASFTPPDAVPLRKGGDERLIGQSLPRLDLPSKVDGSLNYAADVRLPGMVFASVRHGPHGAGKLIRVDRKAGLAIPGVTDIVEEEGWVAAIASTWWVANRAVDALRPRFATPKHLPGSTAIDTALTAAFAQDGYQIASVGDLGDSFKGQRIYTADYSVGLAAHAAIEPVSATAHWQDGQLQLWIGTQAPGRARLDAAKALGIAPEAVHVHAMQVGGAFGRKLETRIAGEVALLARTIGKPVQLIWSRPEDMMQDPLRPAAKARMSARIAAASVHGWSAKIATPPAIAELRARLFEGMDGPAACEASLGEKDPLALAGGVPPYAIPNLQLDHYPADTGLPSGQMRGGSDAICAFFTECFIDELAAIAGVEPFSFRMGMLGGNPRLAACLSQAATLGGWEGGVQGSQQGVACHSMKGSHIAVLAEARLGDDQRVAVTRLVAVADVGRVAHPDIVRQQIESGLMFGMALATGNAVKLNRGVARPLRIGHLGLPRLADAPEIVVELIRTADPAGGVGDIAVPPVAPAIANALHAGSGRRFRTLPLAPVNL